MISLRGATMERNELMQKAIQLAAENVRDGLGGPFAALVVQDGKIIATGTNLVTSSNDPTAHAEIIAIRKACAELGRFDLEGCDIYSSCEPCPMCLGAIYWARPLQVYFAALSEDAARAGFADQSIRQQMRLPYKRQPIAIEQISHQDALLPFQMWRKKSNKTIY